VRGQSRHVINHEDYRTYMHTKGLKERLVRTGLRVIKFEWPDVMNTMVMQAPLQVGMCAEFIV